MIGATMLIPSLFPDSAAFSFLPNSNGNTMFAALNEPTNKETNVTNMYFIENNIH